MTSKTFRRKLSQIMILIRGSERCQWEDRADISTESGISIKDMDGWDLGGRGDLFTESAVTTSASAVLELVDQADTSLGKETWVWTRGIKAWEWEGPPASSTAREAMTRNGLGPWVLVDPVVTCTGSATATKTSASGG